MQGSNQHSLRINSNINRYRIIRILGAGGFGITYLAQDMQTDVQVVIKEYFPNEFAVRNTDRSIISKTSSEMEFSRGMQRFKEEAQTLAKFNHPSIVKILGYFEENNTAYFVMEYEEGIDLSAYLKQKSTLGEEEILSIMMPILEGLKEVHAHNYLHRDIKPGNILLRSNKSPILIDFGASKLAIGEVSKNITSMLTEGYAPLEQYSTDVKQQGAFTDLYAIGAVMYKMITGNTPPSAQTRSHALLQNGKDNYVALETLKPVGYDRNFLRSIDKVLSIKAMDRAQSVSIFQQELLGEIITNLERSSVPFIRETTLQSSFTQEKNLGRNRGLVIGLVVLLILLLVAIGFMFLDEDDVLSTKNTAQKKVEKSIPAVDRINKDRKKTLEKKRKKLERDKENQRKIEREKKMVEEKWLRQQRDEIVRLREEKAREQREELERLRREKAEREKEALLNIPREKVISFNENGIDIHVTYPSLAKAGQTFKITAKMTNKNTQAKQGGLTLSFPDLSAISGAVIYNNFSRIDGYGYPQKIWNKRAGRALPAKYYVIEGWQSKAWPYGRTKTFSIELTAPYGHSTLRVNLRGVLWIKSKYDIREIPIYSNMYDQQGFVIKQFSIIVK